MQLIFFNIKFEREITDPLTLKKNVSMLFNTTSRISSKMNTGQVKEALVGKHVQIKELDFEFKESEGIIKVIPHTENDERSRLVPITHITTENNGNGTHIQISAKPRRIDVGGLYLAIGSIILLGLIGVYLRLTYPEQSPMVAISILALALLAFVIFRMRLQSGYYGYIGNIKSFIKKQLV